MGRKTALRVDVPVARVFAGAHRALFIMVGSTAGAKKLQLQPTRIMLTKLLRVGFA
jgi:hypothetical protein